MSFFLYFLCLTLKILVEVNLPAVLSPLGHTYGFSHHIILLIFSKLPNLCLSILLHFSSGVSNFRQILIFILLFCCFIIFSIEFAIISLLLLGFEQSRPYNVLLRLYKILICAAFETLYAHE